MSKAKLSYQLQVSLKGKDIISKKKQIKKLVGRNHCYETQQGGDFMQIYSFSKSQSVSKAILRLKKLSYAKCMLTQFLDGQFIRVMHGIQVTKFCNASLVGHKITDKIK